MAGTLLGQPYEQRNDQTAEQLDALKRAGWATSWFIREPIQRFLSVYRHFAQLEKRWRAHGVVYSCSREMRLANSDGALFESLEMFSERALNDFPSDKHIAPQTGWGAERAEIVAPLHRADEAWPLICERAAAPLPDKFPIVNSTVSSPGSCDDIPADLYRFYARDIDYWSQLCADFHPEDVSARRTAMDGQSCRAEEMVRPNEP